VIRILLTFELLFLFTFEFDNIILSINGNWLKKECSSSKAELFISSNGFNVSINTVSILSGILPKRGFICVNEGAIILFEALW
jgi:hypothetical protein